MPSSQGGKEESKLVCLKYVWCAESTAQLYFFFSPYNSQALSKLYYKAVPGGPKDLPGESKLSLSGYNRQ